MFKVKKQQIKLIWVNKVLQTLSKNAENNDPTTNGDVHRNQNYVLLLSV